MTRSQETALARLKRLTEKEFYSDNCEFKQWDVEELDFGPVSVVVEYGMKGDEGTLAACLARDWAHIFIGKRGGAWYYDKKAKKHTFRWYSILQAVCDQR